MRGVDLSDEDVIRRVQHGETELFELVFERHYTRIERYLRHLGVAERDREDLAAETFARALSRVASFNAASGTRYVTYLYAIARNLVTDHARTWSRAPELVGLEDADDVVDVVPRRESDPLLAVMHADEVRRVRQAIAKLIPSDREMIYLSFDRELSSKEIMAVMNKPSVTSVTTHLYKAVKKLRALVLADEPREERAAYEPR
jgi:RNA polymerase sigma-70 factor (ECF subfamily)